MSRLHFLLFVLPWISLLLMSGCAERDKSAKLTWDQEPAKYTLLIVADIDVIKEKPRAYDFVIHALDRYFRDRQGEHDQVLISQISGNDRPLLFQGTPKELRKEIPSREKFREFLIARSDPGRRLNEGIAESFDYLHHTFSVARGGSTPVALIISSMQPGENEDDASNDHFIDELIRFHRTGGEMAFYFCDPKRMAWVREQTKKAGMDWVSLEPDPNGYPPLPLFN